ncbi:420_t:CDS:1, partial [Racocetra fulgida]
MDNNDVNNANLENTNMKEAIAAEITKTKVFIDNFEANVNGV